MKKCLICENYFDDCDFCPFCGADHYEEINDSNEELQEKNLNCNVFEEKISSNCISNPSLYINEDSKQNNNKIKNKDIKNEYTGNIQNINIESNSNKNNYLELLYNLICNKYFLYENGSKDYLIFEDLIRDLEKIIYLDKKKNIDVTYLYENIDKYIANEANETIKNILMNIRRFIKND